MFGSAIEPEIRELVAKRDFATLKASLAEVQDPDIAELLEALPEEDRPIVFRLLTMDQAAEVFSLLPLESQELLIRRLSDASVVTLLNEMSPDDRTELLEELPGELAHRLLASLPAQERQIAQQLLNYPEDSVGRLMTPEYVAVHRDWPIQQVLEHIRKVAPHKETVNDLYVVDEHGRLLDHVELQNVVLADPQQKVEALMTGPVEEPALRAAQDQATSVEAFKKYDRHVLPVVDSRGVLVGIVTSDDVLDVQEEEDTEDFQKMAGVRALDEPYFQTTYWRMLHKRLPWLALLLAAEFLTAKAIDEYIGVMGEQILLVVMFMPLVNASAGNAGSQMAGLAIRGLAVQEMELGDWVRILGRELRMGLSLGLALVPLAWLAPMLFGQGWQVSLALAVSLLAAVLVANLAGASIPLALKRLGLDPAVTSAPLIASMMDVFSAVIYFGAVMIVFRLVL